MADDEGKGLAEEERIPILNDGIEALDNLAEEENEDSTSFISPRNKFRLSKGLSDGKEFRFLGYVPVCYGKECSIYDICGYGPLRDGKKCSVMNAFIRSIYDNLVDPENGIGDMLSQFQLDRIGIFLVPLYQQLIKFSIETFTMKKSTYFDAKSGRVNVYPQFKEIRDVQACISKEIRELGLEKIWDKKFGPSKRMPCFSTQDLEEVLIKGQKGAYERLFTED